MKIIKYHIYIYKRLRSLLKNGLINLKLELIWSYLSGRRSYNFYEVKPNLPIAIRINNLAQSEHCSMDLIQPMTLKKFKKFNLIRLMILLLAIIFISPLGIKAQTNCENIGFETGTTDFFQLNKARVSGGMIFDIIPDLNGEQYKIESVQDGYDRIAFNN